MTEGGTPLPLGLIAGLLEPLKPATGLFETIAEFKRTLRGCLQARLQQMRRLIPSRRVELARARQIDQRLNNLPSLCCTKNQKAWTVFCSHGGIVGETIVCSVEMNCCRIAACASLAFCAVALPPLLPPQFSCTLGLDGCAFMYCVSALMSCSVLAVSCAPTAVDSSVALCC